MTTATSCTATGWRATTASAVPLPQPEYPNVPLVLTGLFSLYILVWFLEPGNRIPLLGAIRFEFLLGTVLVGAAAISIAARVESNRSRLTKYICLYFLFLLAHLSVSQYFWESWDAFTNWILKFSCMALFTYAFVRSPRTLRIFVAVLLLAFFKIGQEALWGKVTGSMVWENQGIMRLNGTPGRFGHPNSLSGFAVSMLPFVYYLFPVVQRKWKLCLLLLAVFAINIIVFTGSRTGYLAVIAVSTFLWLRSTKKGRFVAVLVMIVVAGLPFIPEQYEARFTSAFVGREVEGNSKQERLEIAGDAWDLFLANPQGLGIYAFRSSRRDQLGKRPMDTHNLYLQVLSDLGVFGSVVFLLLVFALWRELRARARVLAQNERALSSALSRAGPEDVRWGYQHLADVRFMRATSSAFLAYVFVRLVLGFFGHDLYEIYWWLASGASIAIVNMEAIAAARTAEVVGRLRVAELATAEHPTRERLDHWAGTTVRGDQRA